MMMMVVVVVVVVVTGGKIRATATFVGQKGVVAEVLVVDAMGINHWWQLPGAICHARGSGTTSEGATDAPGGYDVSYTPAGGVRFQGPLSKALKTIIFDAALQDAHPGCVIASVRRIRFSDTGKECKRTSPKGRWTPCK